MADKSVVQLEILSLLDGKGFEETKKQLKTIGVDIKKTGEDGEFSLSKIDSSAKKTGGSFVELAAKITAAYMAVSKMINAYIDDAKASAKMSLALKNNTNEISRQGKSVSVLTKDFKDFASAQQEATGIGDEVTLSLMGTLTTLGVMPKDLKRVTAALQDMEAATGTSADSMARAWARLQEAPEEALGALSRVGVKIRKEMLEGMDAEQQRIFVLEKLEKAFGGQAKAMADSTEGIAQAEAAFGDFQEVLGKVIVSIIGPLAKGLSTILTAFNTLPGPVQGAIVAVGGLTTAFFALSGAINLTPIGWILTATAALGGLAMMATSGVDPLKERIDELNTSLSKLNANMTEMENKDLVRSQQLKNLSMLQRGTSAYEAEVRRLIKSNGELANSGITVKSSYADIIDALKKLDAASATVKRNRLKDISKEAMGTYWSTMSKLTLGPGNVPLTDEANAALATTANNSLIAAARALSMLGKFRFHEDLAPGAPIHLTGPNAQLSEVQAIADFRRALQEMANEGAPAGMQMPLMLNEQQIRDAYNAARALRDTSREAIADINNLNGASTIAQIKVDTIDLWKMNIDLMQDEYEKRRELNLKSYMEEEKRIQELNIYEGDKAEALHLNELKFAQEDEKIRKDQIEAEKQARIQMLNDVSTTLQGTMDVATSILSGNWKSAVGGFLQQIPGVGGALSGVFGSAVTLLDNLIESSSEKLRSKFNAALEAINSRQRELDRLAKLDDDKTTQASVTRQKEAIQRGVDEIKSALGITGDYSAEELNNLIAQNIADARAKFAALPKFVQDTARESFERQIAEWENYMGTLFDYQDQLEDLLPIEQVQSFRDEINRIQDAVDTGRMSEEEARDAMIEQYDAAIASLQGVAGAEDLILELEKERYRLQKGITDESEKGLDIEDEKLRNLLAQREELERNIAAGYVREGTSGTVSQQAAILRQIIARAKELGMSRDDYFQYEEALANLMSGFAGSSYTGKTGFGYTPGVEDFVGNMPIGSSAFQTSMNTARAARSSTSNITTNTQNVTINGQAMVPNQEFVDGLRVLTRRVYGKDIIK
jgi:hypothetical protein